MAISIHGEAEITVARWIGRGCHYGCRSDARGSYKPTSQTDIRTKHRTFKLEAGFVVEWDSLKFRVKRPGTQDS